MPGIRVRILLILFPVYGLVAASFHVLQVVVKTAYLEYYIIGILEKSLHPCTIGVILPFVACGCLL
jgi:hypothetical protein